MRKLPALTGKEKAVIGIEGGLLAIPFVGPSLAHFLSAPLTELTWKRVEATLREVAEMLGSKNANSMVNEEFANLLENVLPDLSRATDEEKRERFRDLLTNAAELPANANSWEEARLAGELLKHVGTPGLVILSQLAKLGRGEQATLASRPVPQLARANFDYENPSAPQRRIPFDWLVVEYWTQDLRQKGLLHFHSVDARGGFGQIYLTERGWFLVKWTLR
jgi:hypothetical protein